MIYGAVDPHDNSSDGENERAIEPRPPVIQDRRTARTPLDDSDTLQEGAQTGLWSRCRDIIRENVVDPLVFSRHPPRFDAVGVCVGFVIGFGVPMGGHILSLGFLRLIFRFNFILAFAFSSVVNPFDIVPLYYGYYWLGSLVLGRPVSMKFEVFRRLMNPVLETASFWEVHSALIQLGCEIFMRWALAAAILAAITGALGYLVTFRIQKKRCMRKAQMLGIQYERYVEELEARADENKP